jgi:hypothetical protein
MTDGAMSSNSSTRLVALIHGCIKTKLVLLALTLFIIWGIWSALEAGHQKGGQLVTEFAKQHPEVIKSLQLQESDLSNPSSVQQIQNTLAVRKRLYSFLVSGMGVDPSIRDPLAKEFKDISELEQQERDQYLAEASLPYLKTTVRLNTLVLADVWPFIVLLTLGGAAAISMRQRACEIVLAFALKEEDSSTNRKSLVPVELTMGRLTKCRNHKCDYLLYRKPLVIVPETLLSTVLSLAAVYLSLKLVALYNSTEIHSTFSILFSYYSLIWAVLVLLALCLAKTKSYFDEYVVTVLGQPVHGARAHWMLGLLRHKSAQKPPRRNGIDAAVKVCRLTVPFIGLGSLTLPFVWPWGIRGYQLLLSQKPMPATVLTGGTRIDMFRIDPFTYRELRVQLGLAVLFLAVWVLGEITAFFNHEKVSESIGKLKLRFGYLILFLAGNFLMYLGVLQFESEQNPGPDILNSFFPEGLVGPHGMSLIFADPGSAAWVFIFVCSALALLSVAQRPIKQNHG